VSELATNALVHSASGAGGQFDVTVLGGGSAALIAVTDRGSDQVPAPREIDPEAETGRGLEFVELIADRWGTAVAVTAARSGSSCAGKRRR